MLYNKIDATDGKLTGTHLIMRFVSQGPLKGPGTPKLCICPFLVILGLLYETERDDPRSPHYIWPLR